MLRFWQFWGCSFSVLETFSFSLGKQMASEQIFIRLKNPLSWGNNFLDGLPQRGSTGRCSDMRQEDGKL